jgi:outer membrane protein insertion porin family
MMYANLHRFLPIGLITLLFLSGCSATKYLKEGESFYAGSEIKFNPVGRVGGKKELKRDLLTLIVPPPNTEVFGMRPGVWLFFRQRDDNKKKGFKAYIRKKFGQVPVLISDIKPDQTAKMLEGQLQNNGYFKSKVKYRIKKRKKESKVIYDVLLYPEYRLRNINYPTPKDSLYARILKTLREKSLLKENQRYDLARVQAEQERIESEVENFGLFYFDDRYLIFQADSTVGKKQIDLDLKLEDGIPLRGKRIFKMGEINIYPDYSLDADTVKLKQHVEKVDSINYHDVSGKFKPKKIVNVVNLRKGNTYQSIDHSLTLSHLMDLGVFKFVNIQYSEMFPDSNLLRADIYLTPLKKRSLRGEFQAVSKSNSFVGPGILVTYTDRNFIKGAELLQVKLNSSYEVQLSKKISGPVNSFELGLESSVAVPRFISPIKIDYSSKKFLPKTDFRVGFNLQNRVGFFRLNSFNLAAGYNWRESESKSHELYPIDINFVKTGKTAEFETILEGNRFLRSSFDDQFILGSRYSYTLNTQLKPDLVSQFEERKLKTHSIYFNGNLQLAGNVLNILQSRAHKDEEKPLELFSAPYSQFVRGDIDFRHYWQLDQHSKLASRIIVGTGYAYGNSEILPYVRQFSIGGSNSLRAFPARSIGPGTYSVLTDARYAPPNELPSFVDQRGDIKLEGNIELRFDIIKAFKGAVFVDAGNIWLWSDDSESGLAGGKFETGDFLSELAVGTGVGLRFDFNFFVLRLDTAFPLRIPSADRKERWVIDDVDFGSSTWRGDNLVFNIGIGYPF